MYESPIELFVQSSIDELCKDIKAQRENYIIKSIEKIGVFVNKEELITALNYDRSQYDKGYDDGYNKAIDDVKEMLSGISYKLYELITDRLDELYKVV